MTNLTTKFRIPAQIYKRQYRPTHASPGWIMCVMEIFRIVLIVDHRILSLIPSI